ncbi:MAG: ribosome recycling factor [Planctomycetota bacterium]
MATLTPDSILTDAEHHMTKSVDHLKHELRGLRTGRASTALVEFVKVDYYGSTQDLKSLAAISVPEATQILVQPFDPSSLGAIKKALEESNLGLNPQAEGKAIRINIPPLSKERRQQLAAQAKKFGEDAKVSCRNARRDANKHAEQLGKDKDAHLPEDELKTLKEEIQDLLKQYEGEIDSLIKSKSGEIMEV